MTLQHLSSLSLIFLFAQICYANPCYLDVGDGAINPQSDLFGVEFHGPANPFWSYVSDDAKSWSFKIIQKTKKPAPIPAFEEFSVKVANSKMIQLKNDLEFKSKTEFSVKPSKVKEIAETYRHAIAEYRAKNPAKLPSADLQILQFYIEFKSPSQNDDEPWRNHHCSIGLGLNDLSISLLDKSKDGKPLNSGFTINVNQPSLEGAQYGSLLPSSFNVQAHQGKIELKGLPIGTFILAIVTKPNEEIPIASMWNAPKSCKLTLQKENEKTWTVVENGCSKGEKPAR